MYRKTDRQIDRQTDRQTDKERQTEGGKPMLRFKLASFHPDQDQEPEEEVPPAEAAVRSFDYSSQMLSL